MPKMKMGSKAVDPNKSTGFGVYEGPEPKNGVYNGIIKSMTMRESKAGNLYFNLLIEFADNEGEKEVYNGFPLWDMVVPGDHEFQQTRVAQLINAVCGRAEADVDYNALDAKEDKGKVNKIGGKNPVGTKVKVNVVRQRDNRTEGEWQVRSQDIFPRSSAPVEDIEVEDVEPVEAEGGVDPDAVDVDELRDELEGLGLPALKQRAKELEIDASELKGKKKPELIDLIVALYEDDEEPEDEDEDEDEADEDSEDELQALDTKELKARAKANGASIKDLKGLDDEGLRELIRGQESGDGDGEEPTEDDEGRLLYDYALTLPREELLRRLVEAGYDEGDFEDEDEYDQEALVDTLVEEDVVAAATSGAPF